MAKSWWQEMEGVSGDVCECGCSEVTEAKEVAHLVVSWELHGGACADTEDVRLRLKVRVNPCGRSMNHSRARKIKGPDPDLVLAVTSKLEWFPYRGPAHVSLHSLAPVTHQVAVRNTSNYFKLHKKSEGEDKQKDGGHKVDTHLK